MGLIRPPRRDFQYTDDFGKNYNVKVLLYYALAAGFLPSHEGDPELPIGARMRHWKAQPLDTSLTFPNGPVINLVCPYAQHPQWKIPGGTIYVVRGASAVAHLIIGRVGETGFPSFIIN